MALTDPVPSQAIDVFKRNMEDSDRFVNQTSGTVTNRTGKIMRPLPVISDAIEQQITSLTADINAAKADLYPIVKFRFLVDTYEITNRNELGDTATGETYRYIGATLPFNVTPATNPVGNPDFVQVIQTDHNNLTNRNAVGAHDEIYVRSYADLSNLKADALNLIPSGIPMLIYVKSYYSGFNALMSKPSGGGEYVLCDIQDVRDSLSDPAWVPDGYIDHYVDGSTQYVLKAQIDSELNVTRAGAKSDGTYLNDAVFQAASNYCAYNSVNMYIPSGIYQFQTGWTYTVTPSDDFGKRYNIRGDGRANTMLRTDLDITILRVLGTGGVGNHSYLRMGGIRFYKTSAIGVASSGVLFDNVSYALIEDCGAERFGFGFTLQDTLSTEFVKCKLLANDINVFAQRSDFSHPNAITFDACVSTGAQTWGYYLVSPSAITMIGGSVEGNALSKLPGDSSGGMAVINAGREGSTSLHVLGTYFEYNVGLADIYHTSSGTDGRVLIDISGTFNRIDATKYVNNNIRIESQAKCAVNLNSGFKAFNTYTPNASRQCVALDGDVSNYKVTDSSFYGSSVDALSWVGGGRISSPDTVALAYGTYDMATDSLLHSVNVESVSHPSTGILNVTCKEKPSDEDNCVVIGTASTPAFISSPNSATTGIVLLNVFAPDGITPLDTKVKFVIYEKSNYF